MCLTNLAPFQALGLASNVSPLQAFSAFGVSNTRAGVPNTRMGVSKTRVCVSNTRMGLSNTRVGVFYTRLCVCDTHVSVSDPAKPLGFPGAGAGIERGSARRLCCRPRRQGPLLNVMRFRGGLVVKAHRLLYHSA